MKTLNVMLSNLGGRVVPIGYEGENLYTRIRINCIEVFSEYPDATVSMVVSPPVGDMYPAVVEKSGVMVIWDITDSVLSSNGSGECQLTFTEGDVVRKSVVFGISINRSLVASGEAPEPVQEWIDRAEQTAQEIAENAAMLAKQDIVESYGEIAPAIIETASGEIASISDGADGMLVKTLTVDVDPVQDLHGYDSPWPAGGGKNLIPYPYRSGSGKSREVTYTINADTTVAVTGTATGGTAYFFLFGNNSTPIPSWIHAGETYTISGGIDPLHIQLIFYGSPSVAYTTTGTASETFTAPADLSAYTGFAIVIQVLEGDTVNGIVKPMLESGSSASSFAPYSNVCPISGWDSANVSRTGVNVWDEEWEVGNLNLSTGANADSTTTIRSKNYIPILPQTAYYFMCGSVAHDVFRICWYDSGKNFISSTSSYSDTNVVKQSPANAYYIRFYCANYGTTYNNDISINYPSTDTQYNQGQVSTTEYEFPQEAGTVYGGSLTIHQDGTGELVVDRTSVTLNGSDGNAYRSNGQSANTTRAFVSIVGKAYGYDNFISDKFRITSEGDVFGKFAGRATSSGIEFYLPVSVPNTNAGVIAWFAENPTQLVYELATPVTYQLTNQQVIALLKGSNNIWADTGDVALEYPADTKLYIDGKVAELQALILENISNS